MNTLIIFALALATAQAGNLGLGGAGVFRSGVVASHGLIGAPLASPLLRTGVVSSGLVGAPLGAHGIVGTAGLLRSGGLYGGGLYGGGLYGGGLYGGGVYGGGLLGARGLLAGPASVW